jgi:hypothetical protein
LPKLEKELEELNEPPPIDKHRTIFYNVIFGILATLSAGLALAFAGSLLSGPRNASWLQMFALVLFALAEFISVAGSFYFQRFIPKHWRSRKKEVERSIAQIKKKIEPVGYITTYQNE